MTKKRLYALNWIYQNEPVTWWGEFVSPQMKTLLERDGLIEKAPNPSFVHMVKYRLSEAGRKVLAEAQP